MTDRLYLPPIDGEVLQGDIYAQMPSVYVEARPLRVARHWKMSGTRDVWDVHPEDGAGPSGGFKWRMDQGGESALLVHAHLGLAMVVTHDCEIENDPKVRTLAMIRPVGELEPNSQEALFSGRDDQVRYAIFPLEAQTTEPTMERAFVDFRRLTTVRPAVLDVSSRVASLSDELRFAVAERFRQYLFRRVERPATDL